MRTFPVSIWAGSVIGVLTVVGPLPAEPPRIARIDPANGAEGVDPTTRELRIEFDQDMDPDGYSLCGGGPTFPLLAPAQGPRGPRWKSARVFVVPVRLEPNHAYEFSVNCSSAKNFRNRQGEPAEATPVKFVTGDKRVDAPNEPKFDAPANVARLRKALDERYAHRELHPVDWNTQFVKFAARLNAATDPPQFAKIAVELLAATDDLHLWLETDGEAFYPTKRRVDANANGEFLKRAIADLTAHNRAVATGALANRVGYLAILTLPDSAEPLDPAFDAIEQWHDAPGIVLDLRFNSGGDERTAQRLAGCFVTQPTPYAISRAIDPNDPREWTPDRERVVEPNQQVKQFAGRVAVLMGPKCMSSCESLLLMLRASPQARLFGEKSWGSSGNPKPVELSDRLTLYLPSWIDMQLDGTPIEGRGVAPDEVVPFPNVAQAASDPVLDAALRWIQAGEGNANR